MPAPSLAAPGWQARGQCGPRTARLFYPPDDRELPAARIARESAAKALCRACPVVEPCREFALATGERHGIWGGLTEADRRRARHPQRPIPR
jgi:WhiB family redox-sensing transcriptional regulator